MGCFRCTGKSSKRSETKNNDFTKNKLAIDGKCILKIVDRDAQTQPSSDCLKSRGRGAKPAIKRKPEEKAASQAGKKPKGRKN